jgi:hypothetical protein
LNSYNCFENYLINKTLTFKSGGKFAKDFIKISANVNNLNKLNANMFCSMYEYNLNSAPIDTNKNYDILKTGFNLFLIYEVANAVLLPWAIPLIGAGFTIFEFSGAKKNITDFLNDITSLSDTKIILKDAGDKMSVENQTNKCQSVNLDTALNFIKDYNDEIKNNQDVYLFFCDVIKTITLWKCSTDPIVFNYDQENEEAVPANNDVPANNEAAVPANNEVPANNDVPANNEVPANIEDVTIKNLLPIFEKAIDDYTKGNKLPTIQDSINIIKQIMFDKRGATECNKKITSKTDLTPIITAIKRRKVNDLLDFLNSKLECNNKSLRNGGGKTKRSRKRKLQSKLSRKTKNKRSQKRKTTRRR